MQLRGDISLRGETLDPLVTKLNDGGLSGMPLRRETPGDTEWHSGGFSKMTLRGLGWTLRGLRGKTRGTLRALIVGRGFSHGFNLAS